MDEEIGGNQAQGFVQDITNQDDAAQDMGLGEDDEEAGEIELGGDDMGDDEDFGGEETFGDEGGEGDEHSEILGKMDELESQLADLKAMLAGDEHGDEAGDDMGDMDDMGGEEEGASDFDSDEMDESQEDFQEESVVEGENPFAKKGSGASGSGKSGSGMSGSGKSGSGKMESYRKTDVEIMKEYVDKIGEIYKGDQNSPTGKMVGTGAKSEAQGEKNTQSVSLESGPDFGGDAGNIVSGKGNNPAPDGKAYTKPKNIYSKGETTFSNEKFQNAPGSNAGKTAFKTKETAKSPEGSTTDGSVAVAKKSVQAQNTGKK